jgi:ATP/ADP translocase
MIDRVERESRPLRILAAIIDVHPGEATVLSALVLLFLCLTVAFICTLSAAFSLFLSTYGVRALPPLYLAMAGAAALVALAYLKLSMRLPLNRLLIVNLSFFLVGSIAVRVGLLLPEHRWVIFVLPAWYQALATLGFLAVWSLADRIFDLQQAKRLLGPVAAGYWLALIVGGFTVPLLVHWLGTENLLLVASVALGFGLVVLLLILKTNPAEVAAPREGPSSTSRPESLFRLDRYVGLIVVFVICASLGFYLVDNILYNRATAQFSSASQLAGFFGVLGGVQGILGLVATTMLTGRILGRYGLRTGLMLTPVLVCILLGILAVTGSLAGAVVALFWLAAGAKVVNVAPTFSLQQSSLEMFYQPLPPGERVRAQTMAEGVIQPSALALTGLLLLGLRVVLDTDAAHLSYLFLALTVVWILVIGAVVRGYSRALARAIRRREEWNPITDVTPESIPVLMSELESPHPEAVLFVMKLLGDLAPDRLKSVLPVLVHHSSPLVRDEALARIEGLQATSTLPAVTEMVERESLPALRGRALRTLAALQGEAGLGGVAGFVDDPNPEIARGAVAGVFRHGGPVGVRMAMERVQTLILSSRTADRGLAATVLGDMGEAGPIGPLDALLHDADPGVRRAALQAAGEAGHDALWPLLLQALSVRATRRTAMAALVRGGERVLPTIEAAMSSPGQDWDVVRWLARICGRIQGANAVSLLLRNVGYRNAEVRTEVLRALRACGFRGADHDVDTIERQITAELVGVAGQLHARRDLSGGATFSMLDAALDQAVDRARERIFLQLSFLYDARAIMGASDALRFGSDRHRAYALEFLGTLLPAGRRDVILPVLVGAEPSEAVWHLQAVAPDERLDPAERLKRLLTAEYAGEDPWIHACAAYCAGFPATQNEGGKAMASTLERVILLKTVSIFANTPDHVLADVAAVVEDEDYPAGAPIVRMGDLGDSMFVIISGRVRVHDGDTVLAELGEREVFGEMTVLHPEPRSASVTATVNTQILCLRREAFYEVAADQVEIVQGIVSVIANNLRARTDDVARLTSRVRELEQVTLGYVL